MNQRTLVIISLVFVVLLSVGITVKVALDERWFQDKAYIDLAIVPDEATVTYGSTTKKVEYDSELIVAPGTHTFTFSREGFADYTEELNLEKDQHFELLVVMTAESDEAKRELEKVKYRSLLEGITGSQMEQEAEAAAQDYKLMGVLPIRNQWYITYFCDPSELDTEGPVRVCIKALNPVQYEKAEKEITSHELYEEDKYIIVDGTTTELSGN